MAENGKPKVAFFDFASCEGCQLTVVDALQTHLELVEAVLQNTCVYLRITWH